MDLQAKRQLHGRYLALHAELQNAPAVRDVLKQVIDSQSGILSRTRDHLSQAKRGDVNVDLTGIEQGLADLGYHNQLLASLDGAPLVVRVEPAGINHEDWPIAADPKLGPIPAAGLSATLSEHNEAVAANTGA